LDSDGLKDVISGSSPGEIFWFRRLDDGSFALGEKLEDCEGVPILVSPSSAAFAADWDTDGHLDLLVGTGDGKVHVVPNQSESQTLMFGSPIALELEDDRDALSCPAPVVADWDGDARHDLVLGAGDGSVYWYRNVGTSKEPKLAAGKCLVPKSPTGLVDDDRRTPGEWGIRAKPCVADWNGDGRPDLLVGDRCGGFEAKPFQNAGELAEELQALQQLPILRQQWAKAFARYRKVRQSSCGDDASERQQQELRSLLSRIQHFKDGIVSAQDTIKRYEPRRQAHGFVWLFLRKPSPP
jgi:hypothetical protein